MKPGSGSGIALALVAGVGIAVVLVVAGYVSRPWVFAPEPPAESAGARAVPSQSAPPDAKSTGGIAATADEESDLADPGNADVLEGLLPSPSELQARIQAEPRDEAWAPYAERELHDYLARQPFIHLYESVEVACRATLCRISAIADPALVKATPGAEFQVMMSNLRHESVWREFSGTYDMFTSNNQSPGRAGFMTFLMRARPDEAPRE